MIIAKPDLSIGWDIRYTSHATGEGQSGSGWVKKTCGGGDDAYFSFMFEVLNSGTETVGTFKVGLLDYESNPLGVQVAIYWTNSGWAIDETRTTAEGAGIVVEGNKKYVTFKATAAQLGMSAGPGEANSGAYNFYLAVDTENSVAESDENNNLVAISITAVKSDTTTGGTNGVIGYDISLMSSYMPKSRSSINGDGTPTGSLIASEDGSGVWTIQMVKVDPQVSVNTVHWYLLDVQGNTVSDGLASDIYGCHVGQGRAVIFVDNDFNGKLSPGDKFVIHPGIAGSELESIGDVSDYSLRLEYVGGTPNEEEEEKPLSPWDDIGPNGNTSSEDNGGEGEVGTLPGFSSLMTIISVGLLAISRRGFNR
jgi:hypothetical protein